MANPLGCAAGLATLETLRDMGPQAYADTHARGARLMEGLQSALDGAGLLASVIGTATVRSTAIRSTVIRSTVACPWVALFQVFRVFQVFQVFQVPAMMTTLEQCQPMVTNH